MNEGRNKPREEGRKVGRNIFVKTDLRPIIEVAFVPVVTSFALYWELPVGWSRLQEEGPGLTILLPWGWLTKGPATRASFAVLPRPAVEPSLPSDADEGQGELTSSHDPSPSSLNFWK